MDREELKLRIGSIWAQGNHDIMELLRDEILDEFDRLTIELDMAGEEIVSRGEQIKTALLSLEGGALRYSQVKEENDRLKAENFLILGRANENGELYLKSREALERIVKPMLNNLFSRDIARSWVQRIKAGFEDTTTTYKLALCIEVALDYLDSQGKDSQQKPQDSYIQGYICCECGAKGLHLCKPKDEEVLREILRSYGIDSPTYQNYVTRDLIAHILEHFQLKEEDVQPDISL